MIVLFHRLFFLGKGFRVYVIFLYLLTSAICCSIAGLAASDTLEDCIISPNRRDHEGIYNDIRKASRADLRDWRAALKEPDGPGDAKVIRYKLRYVIKFRNDDYITVRPVSRYAPEEPYPGAEVEAWPACVLAGDLPENKEEAKPFIKTVLAWGGQSAQVDVSQLAHSALIARYINKNYKEHGITSPIIGLVPYKGTITPQEANETGQKAHPIDDRYYALVAKFKKDLNITESPYINRIKSVTYEKLIELVLDGVLTDPHPENILVDRDGTLMIIDPENIHQALSGLIVPHPEKSGRFISLRGHRYDALLKLYDLLVIVRQEEKAQQVKELMDQHWWKAARGRLFIAGGLTAAIAMVSGVGLYKLISYRRLNNRIATLKRILQLYSDQNLISDRDLVRIVLSTIKLSEEREEVLSLLEQYVNLFRKTSALTSAHNDIEKKLRNIWWNDFSLRKNTWKLLKRFFSSDKQPEERLQS